jgi:NAD(P)-dependent dehydrogenase (short-subunit alcohol dehydrogenase family)
MMNTKQNVLLVTGGSRGIGAAVARLAGKQGYSVIVNYFNHEKAATSIVAQIKGDGGEAVAIQADTGSEKEIIRLFRQAKEAFGTITGLVNNAAITGGFSRVENVQTEMLERLFAVNLLGPILCAREAVRHMSIKNGGKGGSIVNLSSLAARTGGANEWVHYAATKGAINTFTIGLAREVASEGIRVNAVAPGLIETDLHADNGDPDRLKRMESTIPILRAGTAQEVAEGVLWLLSPAAAYTTGSILEIGGGR